MEQWMWYLHSTHASKVPCIECIRQFQYTPPIKFQLSSWLTTMWSVWITAKYERKMKTTKTKPNSKNKNDDGDDDNDDDNKNLHELP